MARQLAGESRVYVLDDSGEVHSFDPGDDVPDWAAKKITNPDVWDADHAEPAPAEDEPKPPYSKWKKPDLEAEVERRNEGRDEDDLIEVEGKGLAADLAAALEADDAAQAE